MHMLWEVMGVFNVAGCSLTGQGKGEILLFRNVGVWSQEFCPSYL